MHRYLEYLLTSSVCWWRKKRIPHTDGTGILVIMRHPLGDTMTELPLLRELRQSFPTAKITVVCDRSNENILEASPCIDALLVYEHRASRHYFRTNLHRTWDFARTYLWQKHIGLAIVPSTCMSDLVDGWLALFSGAVRRFAYTEKTNTHNHHQYMGAYDALFTQPLKAEGAAHEVERNLSLVRSVGGTVENTSVPVWFHEEDERFAEDMLESAGITSERRRVIVNLSTSQPSKDWPVERYVSVCRALSAQYPLTYLLIGAGSRAAAYAEAFCKEIDAYDFTGKTTIRQTLALMKHTEFYLGGDTGPAHFAAACGLHGVVIYKVGKDIGNMDQNFPVRLYPWQSELTVLQPEYVLPGCEQGCYQEAPHCILQVTEAQVLKAMQEQLSA